MSKHITLENLNAALPPLKHIIDKKAEGVDWNESDPAASGYIRNRPFFEGLEEINIIDKTFTFNSDGYCEFDDLTPNYFLEKGEIYTVIWHGVEYECVAYDDGYGDVCIGNQEIATIVDEWTWDEKIVSDEPFFISTCEPDNWMCIYATEGTYTCVVIGKTSIIHKIDEKYLPEIEIGEGASIGIKGTGGNAEVFNGNSAKSANGSYSHSEGHHSILNDIQTGAQGSCSHAEGRWTLADGSMSHAEGEQTTSSGLYSHAEGRITMAAGKAAHAEGDNTLANGDQAHAEGYYTTASAKASHAEGFHTKAVKHSQHVQGKYNQEDTDSSTIYGKYAHIVGNGSSTFARSNAHTLDWNGLGWFAGGLKVGGTGQDDSAAVEVATKNDIVAKTGDTMTGTLIVEGGTDQKSIRLNRTIDSVPYAELMQITGTGGAGLYLTKNSDIINSLILTETSTVLRNPLGVTSGGTGAADAATARANLGITPANIGAATSDHGHALTANSITGTLPISKGGTGSTSASAARTALGITPSNIGAVSKDGDTVNGDLGIAGNVSITSSDCGFEVNRTVSDSNYVLRSTVTSTGKGYINITKDGTTINYLSLEEDRTLLNKPLAISGGGTGANTAAAARENLGITPANIGAATSGHGHALTGSEITGVLSVEKGGTGASTASAARTALGITPTNIGAVAKTGGTLTGNLIVDGGTDQKQIKVSRTVDSVVCSGLLQMTGTGGAGFYCTQGGEVINSLILTDTASVLRKPLTLASGGTGATTKAEARTNLGIYSGTELPAASSYAAGDIFVLY